jgi:hypothetical protein
MIAKLRYAPCWAVLACLMASTVQADPRLGGWPGEAAPRDIMEESRRYLPDNSIAIMSVRPRAVMESPLVKQLTSNDDSPTPFGEFSNGLLDGRLTESVVMGVNAEGQTIAVVYATQPISLRRLINESNGRFGNDTVYHEEVVRGHRMFIPAQENPWTTSFMELDETSFAYGPSGMLRDVAARSRSARLSQNLLNQMRIVPRSRSMSVVMDMATLPDEFKAEFRNEFGEALANLFLDRITALRYEVDLSTDLTVYGVATCPSPETAAELQQAAAVALGVARISGTIPKEMQPFMNRLAFSTDRQNARAEAHLPAEEAAEMLSSMFGIGVSYEDDVAELAPVVEDAVETEIEINEAPALELAEPSEEDDPDAALAPGVPADVDR